MGGECGSQEGSVARSRQAFTFKATWGPFTSTKFFTTATFTAILVLVLVVLFRQHNIFQHVYNIWNRAEMGVPLIAIPPIH
jgi:hypothetical protein